MTHNALAVAERVAPFPATREESTPNAWLRHYAAQSLAAFAMFNAALPSTRDGDDRPDLGYLVSLGVASLSAAVAIDTRTPGVVQGLLWDLTPEAGALNGEWEEWLTVTLDRLGVNPADIDPRYSVGDFRSPSVAEAVTR